MNNDVVVFQRADKLYLKMKDGSEMRFYADLKKLKADKKWRKRVSIHKGEYGQYAVLADVEAKVLDL